MLDAVTATTFRMLSSLRGARVFHPDGVAFDARWEAVDPVLPPDSPLCESGHRTVVRLSRGIGLPSPLPDLLGVAVKVLDVHGEGTDQDLLLVSVGPGPVGQRVLTPAWDFRDTTFSSLLPYAVDRKRTPVVADVHGPGPSTFDELRNAAACALEVQLFLGSGGHFGRVALGRRLDDEIAGTLRFDPWHTADALRPTGVLNRLRRPAYEASHQGRHAPPAGARSTSSAL